MSKPSNVLVIVTLMVTVWMWPIGSAAQEIPAGAALVVRAGTDIDSSNADLKREYPAKLDEPLIVNGTTLAPKGAPAVLRVTQAQQAGAVQGSAMLTLRLVSVTIKGQLVAVDSGDVTSESGSQGTKATKGGVLGGIAGAAIGGAVGGKGGALKGAAIGVGGGVTVAALSGQRVTVPRETRLTFTVLQASEPPSSNAATLATLKPAPTMAPASAAVTSGTFNQVQFQFLEAVAEGKTLTVTLSVTNRGLDRRLSTSWVNCAPVGFIDDAGNSYKPAQVTLGNQSVFRAYADIVNGVNVRMTIRFDGLDTIGGVPTAKEITRLTIGTIVESGAHPCSKAGIVELRNIPIQRK